MSNEGQKVRKMGTLAGCTPRRLLMRVLALVGGLALFCGLSGIALLQPVQSVALDLDFYRQEWRKYGVDQETGMSLDSLAEAGEHLLAYLEGESQSPQIRVPIYDIERDLYNQKELSHLKDVRTLFALGLKARVLSLILALTGTGTLLVCHLAEIQRDTFKVKILDVFANALCFSGTLPLVVAAILAIPAAINFEGWWAGFHLAAFNNDLWLLDPYKDWLIKMFPLEFFFSAVKMIGLRVAVFSGGYIALSFLVRHFASHHRH